MHCRHPSHDTILMVLPASHTAGTTSTQTSMGEKPNFNISLLKFWVDVLNKNGEGQSQKSSSELTALPWKSTGINMCMAHRQQQMLFQALWKIVDVQWEINSCTKHKWCQASVRNIKSGIRNKKNMLVSLVSFFTLNEGCSCCIQHLLSLLFNTCNRNTTKISFLITCMRRILSNPQSRGICFFTPLQIAAPWIQLQWKTNINSMGPCSHCLGVHQKVPLLFHVAALQKGSSQSEGMPLKPWRPQSSTKRILPCAESNTILYTHQSKSDQTLKQRHSAVKPNTLSANIQATGISINAKAVPWKDTASGQKHLPLDCSVSSGFKTTSHLLPHTCI